MLHCWLHGVKYRKILIGMGITSFTLRKIVRMIYGSLYFTSINKRFVGVLIITL